MMEHRLSARRSMEVPSLLITTTGTIPCVVVNTSSSGAYVQTDARLQPDDLVSLVVVPHLPDRYDAIHLSAMVVHAGEDGAGLVFSAPEPGLHFALEMAMAEA